MGTWGTRTFENDEAADWAINLETERDAAFLEASLTTPEVQDYYLEAPEGVRILCACEVIAGIIGHPRSTIPDKVQGWIAKHKDLDVSLILPRSIEKIQRVLAEHSELNELWADNTEDYPTWKADVAGLCDILKSFPPQQPKSSKPKWKFW